MNLTIYKYPLPPGGRILLPPNAEILCVQTQGNEPFVWALVERGRPATVPHELRVIGTGHDIPENHGKYIGTFQLSNVFVFHVFDQPSLDTFATSNQT